MADVQRLVEAGMVPGLAKEFGAQIDAATTFSALSTPSGVRWAPPEARFLSNTSSYSYAGEITGSVVVWGAVRYYVDLTNVTGNANDSNAGTSQAAPLLTYSAARTKANAGAVAGTEIVLFGHKTDVIVKETASWTAVTINYRTVNRELPLRVSLLRVASQTAPTWAATSGQPGVYETTIAAADAAGVVDMSIKMDMASRVQIPVGGTAADRERHRAVIAAAPPAWNVPVKVASIAAVAALPGAWYHDGTKLYVQALDSRSLIGDSKMLPLAGGVFGRTAAGFANVNQQWRGLDWIGGVAPMYVTSGSDTIAGCNYVFDNCSAQAAASGSTGGWLVTGIPRLTLIRCAAWFNWADGFNYHAFAPLADAGPFVAEIECVGGGNGTTGSAQLSDNDSTSHERADIVSQNCVFTGSSDRVVADINFARRWMLGGYVGAPIDTTGSSLANLAAADDAAIYFDGTQFAPSGVNAVALRADQRSVIASRTATPSLSTAGAGTVGRY